MTVREQVALFLFLCCGTGLTILCLLDYVAEKYDEYKSRERVWREIEMRCSRERHPSSRVQLFDQDAQHG
jgi:hypothetical protein